MQIYLQNPFTFHFSSFIFLVVYIVCNDVRTRFLWFIGCAGAGAATLSGYSEFSGFSVKKGLFPCTCQKKVVSDIE